MGRNRHQTESRSNEKINSVPKDSNDLQNKIANKNVSEDKENNTNEFSPLNLNLDQRINEKNYYKDGVSSLVAGIVEGPSRPRRRRSQVSYCPPRSPSPDSRPTYSAKKRKTKKVKEHGAVNNEQLTDNLSRDSNIATRNYEACSVDGNLESEIKKNRPTTSTTAIALDKLEFNVNIDPNIIDRFTDSGFTSAASTSESPETRRRRIDSISRQCRLHPANQKYNHGPIENPPPISPGKIIGFTPGGQRHEVDLNLNRPTWFNSEYARMQWDCATKINVRRMFHELESGTFLPECLDPNIERKYAAEQKIASQQATDYYDGIVKASYSYLKESTASVLSEEDKEHLQLLETENELIELNKYAVVRIQDFAGEIDQKLRKALDLTLTPLMIKKNPLILDTLEILATQCIQIEVVLAARALLDKIKGLFQVPENQEFKEFIAQEVEKLKEKTKNMSGFDILTMTHEPPDINSEDEENLPDTIPLTEPNTLVPDLIEPEDDWVPVENGDVWMDLRSNFSDSGDDLRSYSNYTSLNDNSDLDISVLNEDDDNDWNSVGVSEDSDQSSIEVLDEYLEAVVDDLLGTELIGMLMNGGYRVTLSVSFFEYI